MDAVQGQEPVDNEEQFIEFVRRLRNEVRLGEIVRGRTDYLDKGLRFWALKASEEVGELAQDALRNKAEPENAQAEAVQVAACGFHAWMAAKLLDAVGPHLAQRKAAGP